MSRKVIPFMITACVLCGCAPSYINNEPTTAVESIAMTQADTASKLNKICNDVVATSATLEQQMTKYLSHIVESTVDDKKTIQTSILTNIDVVQENLSEVSSFNPAVALADRTAEIKLELNNTETYLRNLDNAIKENDSASMQESFNAYMNSISQLKSLSMGM